MQSSKFTTSALVRYRKVWILACWLISVVISAFVLVLADFGAPAWVFILCGLWLCSLGLPTTVSILVLGGLWGRIPGMGTPPLAVFAVCVLVLSLFAQTVSFHAATRAWIAWRKS
jgi:hypothetical protein